MPKTTNRALQESVFDAVIATEYPVPRQYGNEVLVCDINSIDLTRFPLPVLILHDMEKLPIGVARNPNVQNGQLRAEIYLDDSDEGVTAGQSITDGVLNHVSVGYQIIETESADENTLVTRWQPYEVSLVAVPADPNARISKRGIRTMTTESRQVRKDAAEIMNLAQRHNMVDDGIEAIERGMPLDQFRHRMLDKISTKPLSTGEIGLSDREVGQFSFARAIQAQASGDWSSASFEHAVLRETRDKATRSNSFVVPAEILQTRDITKTGAPSMVGTDHMASAFIDYLYKQSNVLGRCTLMTGLSGDVSIPRLAGTATAQWYGEQGSITESTPTFDNVVLRPEVLAGMVSYSRKLMAQSQPNVEDIVRRDLAAVLGLELERAILNGSGSGNEPTGILNTVGVNNVALGTDGAAPNWSTLLQLIEAVASANADMSGAFIINSATEAYLRQKQRISATDSVFVLDDAGTIAGREVVISNNVPSNLTKGTGTGLSAVIYGDLSQVLVGQWGGLEVVVDPYTDLQTSTIRVAAFMHTDVGLRHPEAFAFHNDAELTFS